GRVRWRLSLGDAQRIVALTCSRGESLLGELAERRAEPPGREWLARSNTATAARPDRDAFLEAFTAATRRLGRSRLAPADEESARLQAAGVGWPVASWGADELGRVALLAAVGCHWSAAELAAGIGAGCLPGGSART